MIRLPGLIDPHVHLRDPGQTHKEDFLSGTKAALAGGFTTVLDMPNNLQLITTVDLLKEKQTIAKKKVVSDIGFYFGSLGDNIGEFAKVENGVFGLKLFLNQTTGGFVINLEKFKTICDSWTRKLPILVHAEEDILEIVLQTAHNAKQKIHVCHVSSQKELEIIIAAKKHYSHISCGVCPHHLFLSAHNAHTLGAFGKMKPVLKSPEDVAFLWNHLADIDLIESDHAPHTLEEKKGDNPPFGIPGLETTLPLLLTAVHKGKITLDDIQRLCHDATSEIFGIHSDSSTYIEIDESEKWELSNATLFTKWSWTPFAGWEVYGKVKRVFIRGRKVFENGLILNKPGDGQVLKSLV